MYIIQFNLSAIAFGCLPFMMSTIPLAADDVSSIAGLWAIDRAACKLNAPDYDDRLKINASGKNTTVESECHASSVRSYVSWLTFNNVCRSEGARFKTNVRVEISPNDMISWKDGKNPPTNYFRCSGEYLSQQTVRLGTGAKAFPTGSFSLSSHSYSATITSLNQPDSANSSMVGRVTQADAVEECERNSPGGEGLKPNELQKCIGKTLKTEAGKIYSASADCKSRTITPSMGGKFTVVGLDANGNARIIDIKRNDIGSATASGAPSIEDQFAKLCPATFQNLKRR